jgi:hypothetical protein
MIISDDIHNYYEKLVTHYFTLSKFDEKYDEDFLADLTCVVLNQLPTRYIRHEVDMAFYLPASERFEMEAKVKSAISKAIEFMVIHRQESK